MKLRTILIKISFRRTAAAAAVFAVVSGALQACSSALPLACTASASVSSGNPSAPNTTVVLSGVSVAITNGTGPYTLVLPNGTTASSSTSAFTYPSTLSLTTGSAGGVSSTVTVTDTASSTSTTCSLSVGGLTSSSGTLTVTAAPSTSAAVGGTITLTASDTSYSGSTFTFSLASAQSGVSLVNLSSTQASVTSTVAATVTITVTEAASGSGTTVASTSTTLYFGTSSGTTGGSVQVTASPSTSVAVGTPITLTAYDTAGRSGATFSFVPTTTVSGVSVYNSSTTSATVTSTVSASVTITVYEYVSGAQVASSQISLSFGGGTTGTSLTCQLLDYCQLYGCSGYYCANQPVAFYIQTSTGERVRLTQLYTGEPWYGTPPTFPMSISDLPPYSAFSITYDGPGTKTVQAQAESESRLGTLCNGGALMQAVINVH